MPYIRSAPMVVNATMRPWLRDEARHCIPRRPFGGQFRDGYGQNAKLPAGRSFCLMARTQQQAAKKPLHGFLQASIDTITSATRGHRLP